MIYFTLILSFLFAKGTRNCEKDPVFAVYFSQNNTAADIIDNTVTLDKKSFDLLLGFSEPMGVLVNASFDSKTYDLALKGKALDKLPGFEQTGMAEGLLNTDKEIVLSEEAPGYWFYDNEEEHRFNEVQKTDTGFICLRTIEKLVDADNQTEIRVSEVNQPLYLVFISYKRGQSIMDRVEVQRQCIKIEWRK